MSASVRACSTSFRCSFLARRLVSSATFIMRQLSSAFGCVNGVVTPRSFFVSIRFGASLSG